jgi:hypothetical protein
MTRASRKPWFAHLARADKREKDEELAARFGVTATQVLARRSYLRARDRERAAAAAA